LHQNLRNRLTLNSVLGIQSRFAQTIDVGEARKAARESVFGGRLITDIS